jgi:hypothetical protein
MPRWVENVINLKAWTVGQDGQRTRRLGCIVVVVLRVSHKGAFGHGKAISTVMAQMWSANVPSTGPVGLHCPNVSADMAGNVGKQTRT